MDPTTLHIDNQSAICPSHNTLSHEKSKHIDIKHIDIRYHIIRERGGSKELKLAYNPTGKQWADVLTRALDGISHGKAIKAFVAPCQGRDGKRRIKSKGRILGETPDDGYNHRRKDC